MANRFAFYEIDQKAQLMIFQNIENDIVLHGNNISEKNVYFEKTLA